MSQLSQRVKLSVNFKISFRAKFAVFTNVREKKERNCNCNCRYRLLDLQVQRSSTTSLIFLRPFTEAHPRYKILLHSRVTLNKEVNTTEPRKTKGAKQRQSSRVLTLLISFTVLKLISTDAFLATLVNASKLKSRK